MTQGDNNERLKAALDFGKLSPHERRLKVYQARKSPPIEVKHDPFAEFVCGPTVPVRMNRRLKELIEAAFPDAYKRKETISRLVAEKCIEVLKKLHNSPTNQNS